nr:hypothetical protein CFP56_43691 [Quercus suber]
MRTPTESDHCILCGEGVSFFPFLSKNGTVKTEEYIGHVSRLSPTIYDIPSSPHATSFSSIASRNARGVFDVRIGARIEDDHDN